MHQLPESGNFDIRHLESLRGFDIKRPGYNYGNMAEKQEDQVSSKKVF